LFDLDSGIFVAETSQSIEVRLALVTVTVLIPVNAVNVNHHTISELISFILVAASVGRTGGFNPLVKRSALLEVFG
jgi:hypothetical protein